MSTLPDTDLSAALVTDSGFEDTLFAALGRLRTIARIAGLHLTLGYPGETPTGSRLPLGDVTESTARELAALLTPASDTASPTPGAPGIAGAAVLLRAAAEAAGIDLLLRAPRIGSDGLARIPLGSVDHDTALRLAHLVEQHMTGLYETGQALRAALEAVGITADQLVADDGAIQVGDITVPEGVALLRHLSPGETVPDADPDDHAAGEDLAARLSDAVKQVTDGGFLDAAYTPYCRRCRSEAALVLGRLEPKHTQALTAHLVRAVA
ncbi:hypothetical protein [Streptomyces sp. HPF1205]|uniref:hypothetical protein n=1 Tax=Streptomyces sp. HPF1205 TaxID=2873262 RepID=UPI001CEDE8B6|nr:hypothetical protein [Streptomyces sp. HPF1205]